jgi:hypothetical protein
MPALSQQQRLRRGDGLPEPQQVNQQLGGVPRSVITDMHDPLGVAHGFQQRTVPFHQARVTADK